MESEWRTEAEEETAAAAGRWWGRVTTEEEEEDGVVVEEGDSGSACSEDTLSLDLRGEEEEEVAAGLRRERDETEGRGGSGDGDMVAGDIMGVASWIVTTFPATMVDEDGAGEGVGRTSVVSASREAVIVAEDAVLSLDGCDDLAEGDGAEERASGSGVSFLAACGTGCSTRCCCCCW